MRETRVTFRYHPHTKRVRVYDDPSTGHRCYVHRTNVGSYVVATCYPYGLDDLVEFGGDYHHATLKELRIAIEARGVALT